MAADPSTPQLPDLHTTAGRLAQLRHKVDEAVHAGSEAAVEKQHARGKGTARERIEPCSTKARSSSSTPSPGTGRRTSGWRATGPTATGS